MIRPLVKFCGMTRLEDVKYAVELGVDFIGVILVEGTPRYISLQQAQKIRDIIPAHIQMVTVIRNASESFIKTIISEVKPDFIQFHGDETPEFCAGFNYPFWKAIAVKNKKQAHENAVSFRDAAALVFDAWSDQGSGGHGIEFDWSFIPDKNAGEKQLIGLAGGLTPENIKKALPLFHQNIIDFVDVSSGTEAAGVLQVKGQKSSERMHAFMQEIRI